MGIAGRVPCSCEHKPCLVKTATAPVVGALCLLLCLLKPKSTRFLKALLLRARFYKCRCAPQRVQTKSSDMPSSAERN